MANDTLTAIKDGIGGLTTLEILTLVGSFELTADQRHIEPGSIANADKILSRIGLVDGDIQTAMTPAFVTDPAYAELRTFHQQQVENGHTIIQRNIEALGKLVAFIRSDLEKGNAG